MSTSREPFLVLVTGHAGAGKTTIAEKLSDALGAVWISRDRIHEMVYSGWQPEHPALTAESYDPRVGESVFFEGGVVWSIFLWMLQQVSPRVPVVADTPFNHDWNRSMFAQASASITVPIVEVALDGDGEVLLERAKARAARADVHEIKARFSVNPARYVQPYQPVLSEDRVVRLNTTNLDTVDVASLARQVLDKLELLSTSSMGTGRSD